MGCKDSNGAIPSLETLHVDFSEECETLLPKRIAAVCRHPQGLFRVSVDGSYTKLDIGASSSLGNLGLRISDSEIFALGTSCPVRFDILTHRLVELRSSRWRMAKGVVFPLKHNDHVLVFHDYGLYRVSFVTGEWARVGSSSWTLMTCVVHDPINDVAWAFHDHGLYRVELADGSSTKLGTSDWNRAKGAVWTQNGIVVLHDFGVDRVSTVDGSCAALNSESWSQTRTVVDAGDGTVLVFHSQGIFKMRLNDGSYYKIPGSGGWALVRGVIPLSIGARAVSVPGSIFGARDAERSHAMFH
eukprot:TRINITY_DN72128_c0_g1_i1.p1 TRINITY_DN72128_c0_g1~~TRINITY_DN72128_c0_g1_i1.p1  ORF type:complete len:310 (+),score=26.78 TRINITY_DN72128_c0_g1_i1:33-932(+)